MVPCAVHVNLGVYTTPEGADGRPGGNIMSAWARPSRRVKLDWSFLRHSSFPSLSRLKTTDGFSFESMIRILRNPVGRLRVALTPIFSVEITLKRG